MKLWPSPYSHDTFIIHAVEDRETITSELCTRLSQADIRLWYSGKDLTVGCNIHQEIMYGLSKSRYGVLILSPDSVNSDWLAVELFALLSRAQNNSRKRTILPVLHGISRQELRKQVILPDNTWMISSKNGVKEVADELVKVIKSKPASFGEWLRENAFALKFWLALITTLAVVGIVNIYYQSQRPHASFLQARIAARIEDFQNKIVQDYELNKQKAQPATLQDIRPVYTDFMALKSYYRNEYEFSNDVKVLRSRRSVEDALSVDLAALSPHNSYGFDQTDICYAISGEGSKIHMASYSLLNSKPLTYEIVESGLVDNGRYQVVVNYRENIRYIAVNLFYPAAREIPKKHQVSIKGFFPTERYTFERRADGWVLTTIE